MYQEAKGDNPYLSCPPPFTSMHLVIYPHGMICINIMALRHEYQIGEEVWVTVQGSDTFQSISEVDIEGLIINYDLVVMKCRTSREPLVNNYV